MRAWNDEQLKLTCAVNVPPTLVTDLSFPDRVAALLGRYSLDGSQLVLEITETATMQNPTMTMDILTRLRVKRIGLSLDDFGTGYSSLTQLYQMPFNEMKIDKSLVINVPHSREANTMVGSLIELGHNLGLKICAEGVENRAALDMLAILRCDRCQGFFISRAVPAHDISSLVSHWNRESPAAVVHVAADARPSERNIEVNENRLLVVDDDWRWARSSARSARTWASRPSVLLDPAQFAQTVLDFSPTVLLLDLQMPGRDGIELLRELSTLDRRPKVLIASGLDSRVLTTASELGISMGVDVAGAFCKPIALDELEVLLVRLKSQKKVMSAAGLRQAIDNGNLVVHYLPKATFKGPGRWIIEGAEALVRWEHPEYGLLYPRDFIGIAEQSGLITEVTDFVFRASMEQARVWFANGLYMELGVNLSAQFLGDLGFPDRLLTLIRENNLDPSMITIELMETASMQDPAVALDILARLRVKNINLCLRRLRHGPIVTHAPVQDAVQRSEARQPIHERHAPARGRARARRGPDLPHAQAQDAGLRRGRRGRRHSAAARADALRQGAGSLDRRRVPSQGPREGRRELERPVPGQEPPENDGLSTDSPATPVCGAATPASETLRTDPSERANFRFSPPARGATMSFTAHSEDRA